MVSRTPRKERIAYAESHIARYPGTGKRGLQRVIKSQFGIGLSDTERRAILRRANTPGTLRARINTKAFYPGERKVFREFIRKGNPPYVKDAINHRWSLYARARTEGWTRNQYRRAVREEAIAKGWIVKKTTKSPRNPKGRRKGQIDIYAMIKEFRDKSTDKGDYIPLPSKKPRTDKGNIQGQKARYREKQSEKSKGIRAERERTRIQRWIREKDTSISKASGARKQQLIEERKNLEEMLRRVR